MKDKLQKAIYNNNGLYEAIFSGRNITFDKTASIWYSLEKTPPLYSNFVTVCKDWKPDDVFRRIDLNSKKEAWEEWSIKDSFSVLNLSEYGFAKLFDAQWFYLEAADFTPAKKSGNLSYEIVNSEEILSAWRLAWDSDERLGRKIFDPKLLENSSVFFVAGYFERQIVSGCFVNKTAEVLGVSNFFAPGKDICFWSDTVRFIYDSVAPLDIVGYERRNLAGKLRLLGFESTGNLAVWLKKRSP